MTVYFDRFSIPKPSGIGAGDWVLESLPDVTFLVGKNGSGKSVLLRALRNLYPTSAHYVVPERTGEMDYHPNYVRDELDATSRNQNAQRNYSTDYRRRIVGRVQTYFMARGNFRGDATPGPNPTELERLLETLVPDFTISLGITNPPYQLRRIGETIRITTVDELSSGEAQLLTLGLDILTIAALWELQGESERLILVDEPDAHIHPDLQVRFADFLLSAVNRFHLQAMVATHSLSLLAAAGQLGSEDVGVVYLTKSVDVYTARTFDSVRRELATILGGHVLMGPLFGAPLLLVEGDDDYRVWSQVPRHHNTPLAVLPSGGSALRRYQLVLERTLSAVMGHPDQPVGYALLDGDQSLPTPNPENPQDYIRYLRLNCREVENLYLTQEVLSSLGLTWEHVSVALTFLPDLDHSLEPLRGLAERDRRVDDLKRFMPLLVQVCDKSAVEWTLRIGRVLGKDRPRGELADYLGREVVESIWGLPGA